MKLSTTFKVKHIDALDDLLFISKETSRDAEDTERMISAFETIQAYAYHCSFVLLLGCHGIVNTHTQALVVCSA